MSMDTCIAILVVTAGVVFGLGALSQQPYPPLKNKPLQPPWTATTYKCPGCGIDVPWGFGSTGLCGLRLGPQYERHDRVLEPTLGPRKTQP